MIDDRAREDSGHVSNAQSEEWQLERRKRAFDRFLLFSDAVVAIAITLLILPVVERASEISGGDDLTISTIFHETGGQIFGFLLSFMMIAVMWLRHQSVFANVQTINRSLTWANLGWLLTIIFMAFTTALTALHGNETIAAPIYIANIALSSLMLTIAATILKRNPEMLYPDTPISVLHLHGGWLATGLTMVAVVIAILVPGIGYFAMFVHFLQHPIGKRLFALDGRDEWD